MRAMLAHMAKKIQQKNKYIVHKGMYRSQSADIDDRLLRVELL